MYLDESTANFENFVNITVDSDSVLPQEKQNDDEEDCQENPYKKKRQTRVLIKSRGGN